MLRISNRVYLAASRLAVTTSPSQGVAAWLSKPLDFDRFPAAVESLAVPAHLVPRSLFHAPLQVTTRVLVVEDEHSIRNVLVEYQLEEGYGVDTAASIVEAHQRIDAGRPDLVLLDLMLPGESGWDFLRERANEPALTSMRVLVLSAAPRSLLMQAKDFGADAFLSKPFDLDVLSAMIESFGT